jgi:hypothetical protein
MWETMKLTRLDEGRLEHVGEKGENRVEGRKVFLLCGVGGDLAVLNSGEEFSEDRQIQDERSCKQRILRGEERYMRSQKNIRAIFIPRIR